MSRRAQILSCRKRERERLGMHAVGGGTDRQKDLEFNQEKLQTNCERLLCRKKASQIVRHILDGNKDEWELVFNTELLSLSLTHTHTHSLSLSQLSLTLSTLSLSLLSISLLCVYI